MEEGVRALCQALLFLILVKLEEELNGGENIYRLLSVADAGWWISYEGENNGFAEMTE